MASSKRLAGAGLLSLCAAASAQTIFDSQGFEGYTLGPLDGQNGWQALQDTGGLGAPPMVVDASGGDHVLGTKAVRLSIPDIQGAQSGLQLPLSDLLAQGYTRITVDFDVYRESSLWASNLWWYWFDNGDPTYGLMWDVAQAAYAEVWALGFQQAAPHPPVVFDQYRTVSQTWDFTTGQATSSYNGVSMAPFTIANIVTLTGWAIYVGHDEATGSGPETVWIDNFRITGQRPCYANCDGSTTPPALNVLDFGCFLNRFAAGDTYANCDGSTTPPVLNVLDFGCFLNRFAAGCT